MLSLLIASITFVIVTIPKKELHSLHNIGKEGMVNYHHYKDLLSLLRPGLGFRPITTLYYIVKNVMVPNP